MSRMRIVDLLENGEILVVLRHEQTAFGDACWGDALQLPAELAAVHAPGESCLERSRHTANLFCGFVDEFQTEVANAGVTPRIQMHAGFLSLCAEDSVAATDVGHH